MFIYTRQAYSGDTIKYYSNGDIIECVMLKEFYFFCIWSAPVKVLLTEKIYNRPGDYRLHVLKSKKYNYEEFKCRRHNRI